MFTSLLSALDILNNIDHRSRKYPALAYWVDKLVGFWIEQRKLFWWTQQQRERGTLSDPFRSDPKIKILRRHAVRVNLIRCNTFGVFYQRDILYHLALHHPDTFWGQAAFVELSSIGWNIGDPVENSMNPSVARAVVRHGEKFLKQRPTSPFYVNVLFDVADAYHTIWIFSRDNEGGNKQFAIDAFSSDEGKKARGKAARYFREFVRRGGRVTDLLAAQIFSIRICRSCHILPHAVDVKERLASLEEKSPSSSFFLRYFHLDCE